MKNIKWKILIITSIVCLLPVFLGVALWDRLPQEVPIHFDINNTPDNFASKTFAVFGLPLMMFLLQIICCIINDFNAKAHGERAKFSLVTKWILPCMSIVLQSVTFAYAIGYDLDIRKISGIIVGIIFLLIGNYLPKFDYIKNYNIDSEKAIKANRFIGFITVIMGVVFIISSFLAPIATIIALLLILVYAIVSCIYVFCLVKKK